MDAEDEVLWSDLTKAEQDALIAAYHLMIEALDSGGDG